MAILYKLYKMVRTFKDGRTDKANNHWFARAIHTSTVTTDQLADDIAYATTATPADCRAVLAGLAKVMTNHLQNSSVVHLDGIGSFRINIQCSGAETVADFGSSNIKGLHIRFMPEYTMDKNSGRKDCPMLRGASCRETPKNDVVKE